MKKKSLGRTLAVVLCMATVFPGCGNATNAGILNETMVQSVVEDIVSIDNSENYRETSAEIDIPEEAASTEVIEATNTSENSELTTEVSAESVENSEQGTDYETENEETKADYSVTELDSVKTMYATQSLNVRKGPGTEYEKVDVLSTNEEVKVTGQSGTWYRLENGNFVSGKYLTETKVVVPTPTPESTPAPNPAPTQDSGSSDNGGSSDNQDSNNSDSNHNDSSYSDNAGSASTPEVTPEPTPEPTPESTPEAAPEPEECEHDYEYTSTFTGGVPTCSNRYWDNYKCQKCGDLNSIEMPPTGQHNYVIESEFGEALCADYRWVMYVCTYCLDRYSEEIYDPNNHVEGGTLYDEYGNCYGCGVHIHDGICEDHVYTYDSSRNWWECQNCHSGYSG